MKQALLSALLGLTTAIPGHADPSLGRLLLTPPERVHLDRQRWHNPRFEPGTIEGSENIEIHGEVRRNGQLVERWGKGSEQLPTKSPIPVGGRLESSTGKLERQVFPGSVRVHPASQ